LKFQFKEPEKVESYLELKEKVFKTIKKYNLINKKDKILLALSGGKDSSVLALILKDFIEEKLRKDLKSTLLALHVDVGIFQNRIQMKRAEELCKKFDIPFKIVKAPINIDQLYLKKKENVCNVCGIQRRYFYMKVALENGLNTIATGHNLNDEAETFLMNVLQNNWKAAIENYIIKESKELPKKIKPLYFVSNEETKKVAIDLGIIEEKKEKKEEKLCLCDCPYSPKSFRYFVRTFLYEAQKWDKSILNKIINFSVKFYEEVNKNKEKTNTEKKLNKCKICGMPSTKEICKLCELKEKISKGIFKL
jgi:tRNA(Ile)-lysidine synthase TilS/MesJ